jgi:Icc-related predicted phosphoesterase
MRDFSRVRIGQAPFTPEASAALFARDAAWLERKLAEPHAGPTVVVTHHAPSRRSVHPRFDGSPLNACFVSDLEHLLDGRACLWIHGHTHDSFDYVVGGTRVVCNPRGYAKNGVDENPRFDADFCVNI